MIEPFILRKIAKQALKEDLAYGDITTDTLFPHPIPAIGHIRAKGPLVVAGMDICLEVFKLLDACLEIKRGVKEGQEAKPGETIVTITADGHALLKGERSALNFLQRLCGIATLTRKFVEAVKAVSEHVCIMDTRKTTPGLRALEKEAVRLGGGLSHRHHLGGDLLFIKDNHIALAGGVTAALTLARKRLSPTTKIEVEVTSLAEVGEAIAGRAEIILLDNMSQATMREAVVLIRTEAPTVRIEASGGVCLENVTDIAATGVDMISIGRLTHSAPASDLSMDISTRW